MKIAILGYGVEGKASYEYFASRGGNELTIRDNDPGTEVPAGAQSVLGEAYLDNLDEFDLIVRSPGIKPSSILAKNPNVGNRITSLTNEFMRVCPTKNVIGVTGSKGKGTTSTLISEMLKASSKDVYLGGNIGQPPLEFLDKLAADSWVVLELSSFQLIDLKSSPHIGVCLMVVPEHLDWHPDVDEYYSAKSRLFEAQQPDDIAIYFNDSPTSKKIASAGPGKLVPYFAPPGAFIDNDSIAIDNQVICSTKELKLLGAHNWQNACAAVTAVWQINQDLEAIRSVLTTFSGLPHRLELVRELNGVKYYDDSFGTAPETAIVAMEAFEAPEIIILGGRGKGVPFDGLAKAVAGRPNIKQVITIGETAAEITADLAKEGYNAITVGGKHIQSIVNQAQQLAEAGDIVLLSTACTSFDMFKNYKDRGERFNQAVQALV